MGSGRRRKQNSVVAVFKAGATGPRVRVTDRDDATRQAVMDIIQLWLDRLQLVSVITTFFASTDGLVLGYSTTIAHLGSSDANTWDPMLQLMNACLIGALIFHTCSAIIAFIASFVMIRYKLKDATKHELDLIRSPSPSFPDPISNDSENLDHTSPMSFNTKEDLNATFSPHEFLPAMTDLITSPFQNHISINRVDPFWFLRHRRKRADHSIRSPPQSPSQPPAEGDPESPSRDVVPQPVSELGPPVDLLMKCHTMSVLLASIGFLLALIGIISFVWKALPKSVSIFSTASLGVCAIAAVFALS